MAQIAVYLDDGKIMDNMMLIEPVSGGVRLVKMFETPRTVPAVIRPVGLIKNRLILGSIPQGGQHAGK